LAATQKHGEPSTQSQKTPLLAPCSNRTIGKHFIRAKLPLTASQQPLTQKTLPLTLTTDQTPPKLTFHPCKEKFCFLHKLIDKSTYAKSSITQRKYPIRQTFSCLDTNIMYLITCTNCKTQYIDNTHTTLRLAMAQHAQQITIAKLQPTLPVHAHFATPNHSMKIQPLETTVQENTETKKSLWIHRIKCKYPLGLNV